MALEALRAGKHVLLEKPLALSAAELADIVQFFEQADAGPAADPADRLQPPVLAVRRAIRDQLARRSEPDDHRLPDERRLPPARPLDARSRRAADAISARRATSTTCSPYLTGARVERVAGDARHADDRPLPRARQLHGVDCTFDDGSVATLTYTALGSKEHPKERLESSSTAR